MNENYLILSYKKEDITSKIELANVYTAAVENLKKLGSIIIAENKDELVQKLGLQTEKIVEIIPKNAIEFVAIATKIENEVKKDLGKENEELKNKLKEKDLIIEKASSFLQTSKEVK